MKISNYQQIKYVKEKKTIPYEIKASNISLRNNHQKIPYTIIQTMKTNVVPEKMYNAAMSWVQKNPEYDYLFFDDEKCKQFLKDEYPFEYYHLFEILGNGATKADFFRWCYLYKKGGVYLDIDTICKIPIKEYMKPEYSFVSKMKPLKYFKSYSSSKYIVNNKTFSKNTIPSRINHSILATIKNTKVLQKCIKKARYNILKCYFNKQDYKYPFYLCGPGLLGNILNKMLGRNKFEPFNTIEKTLKIDDEIIKIFPSKEIDMYMITKYPNYSFDCNQIKATSYWTSLSFDYEKAKVYFLKNDLILKYNK